MARYNDETAEAGPYQHPVTPCYFMGYKVTKEFMEDSGLSRLIRDDGPTSWEDKIKFEAYVGLIRTLEETGELR